MGKKEDNLKPFDSTQSREKAKINGKKGGLASGKAKRERKTIVEGIKLVLEGKGMTQDTLQDEIIVKVLKRLLEDGRVADLKTLSELLGETKGSTTTIPIINVITQNSKEKDNIDKL